MQEGVGPLCICDRPIFWALKSSSGVSRDEAGPSEVKESVLISGGSQMELTGLEPVTSWVRSRRQESRLRTFRHFRAGFSL